MTNKSPAPIDSAKAVEDTGEQRVFDCLLVRAYGETEHPAIEIVNTLDEARAAVMRMMFTDPDADDIAQSASMFSGFESDMHMNSEWEITFEIGGITVEEVTMLAAPTPSTQAVGEPEKIAPVQGYTPGIPWSLHLEAYAAYSKKWSPQPAMIDLEGRNCRGGFGVGELDEFIPGWRDHVSEIGMLKARVAELEAQIAFTRKRIKELGNATLAEPDADVRNEIIEKCAQICDGGLDQVYANGWVDCANERKRCAAAIRALANGTEAT